jgi:hypothetical protein
MFSMAVHLVAVHLVAVHLVAVHLAAVHPLRLYNTRNNSSQSCKMDTAYPDRCNHAKGYYTDRKCRKCIPQQCCRTSRTMMVIVPRVRKLRIKIP